MQLDGVLRVAAVAAVAFATVQIVVSGQVTMSGSNPWDSFVDYIGSEVDVDDLLPYFTRWQAGLFPYVFFRVLPIRDCNGVQLRLFWLVLQYPRTDASAFWPVPSFFVSCESCFALMAVADFLSSLTTFCQTLS